DAILAVGTKLIQAGGRSVAIPPGVPFARIDADGGQFYRGGAPTVGIVADAKLALASLVDLAGSHNRSRPDRTPELAALKAMLIEDIGTIEPQGSFGRVLREEMPDDAIFVSE